MPNLTPEGVNQILVFAIEQSVKYHSTRPGVTTDTDIAHTAYFLYHLASNQIPPYRGEDDPPWWAQRLLQLSGRILKEQGDEMALLDDLNAGVAALTTEAGEVVAVVQDLATKAANQGSVSDADVQAALASIATSVTAMHSQVVASDPGVVPTPAGS
ncbi:MAG: hypothetical protein ACRDRO_23415 [Pseudonocardiaceae bacterium]